MKNVEDSPKFPQMISDPATRREGDKKERGEIEREREVTGSRRKEGNHGGNSEDFPVVH